MRRLVGDLVVILIARGGILFIGAGLVLKSWMIPRPSRAGGEAEALDVSRRFGRSP